MYGTFHELSPFAAEVDDPVRVKKAVVTYNHTPLLLGHVRRVSKQ